MSLDPGQDDLATFAAGATMAATIGGVDAVPAMGPAHPTAIGRYRILRLIGEGGMGAVYEAEQDQPRRTVALKVIKPGLAGPEILRRFAQEAQALGRLQHPGIAQIYDAGTADAGHGTQPYFAMEYVRGQSLVEYAGTRQLSARQRLALMAAVCDAVHHAHQRGLIHRDLKPANILVDETGQPKILDFGVARIADSDVQATLQTDVGQLVGTLAYMSPEQVLADPLDIDTRSDVYALGVIIYELLAGRLPYEISRRLPDALLTIREHDPSKLSSIDRTFRGDIETIAAKALEKDKARRYASAAELAGDIRRFLDDEPIIARPPSTTYQLQKFARRHTALVGGLVAVFVVLMGGIVVSTWQAARAKRAEAAALLERDRATTAERAATTARDEAIGAQKLAVEAEGRARQERDRAVAEKERADVESATARAVTEFLQKNLFEQVSGGASGGAPADLSVSGALARAAANVDGKFPSEPLVEAGVREAIAAAYLSLSRFADAGVQVERALSLRRPAQGPDAAAVLKAEHMLATVYAGQRRFADSERLLERVVASQARSLGPDHPDTLRFAWDLGATYLADNRPDRATAHLTRVADARLRTLGGGHRDTITALLVLAAAHEQGKKPAEAVKIAGVAYENARRALGEGDSLTLNVRAVLQRATLAASSGTVTRAARDEFLESAARGVNSVKASSLPELINLAASRATIAVNQNRPQDAEAPLLEALEAGRRAGQEELNLTAMLAGVYALQRKYGDAEATLARVTDRPEAGKTLNPNVLPFALRSLGASYRNDRRFADAERHFRVLVPLVLASPGEGAQQTRVDLQLLADTYSSLGRYADAERWFTQLLDVQRRLTGPEQAPTLLTMTNLGWVLLKQGRHLDAEDILRAVSSTLARTTPQSWEYFNVSSMLGAALAGRQRFADAEPLLIAGYEGMAPRQPASNPNLASRFTVRDAGEAILRLYADIGNDAKRQEWAGRLSK